MKLPVQVQHELSAAGKSEAFVEQVKTFIHRQIKYQQTTVHYPFDGMSSNKQQKPRQWYNNEQQNTEKPKFNENCQYCGKSGHGERKFCSKKTGPNSKRGTIDGKTGADRAIKVQL